MWTFSLQNGSDGFIFGGRKQWGGWYGSDHYRGLPVHPRGTCQTKCMTPENSLILLETVKRLFNIMFICHLFFRSGYWKEREALIRYDTFWPPYFKKSTHTVFVLPDQNIQNRIHTFICLNVLSFTNSNNFILVSHLSTGGQ